MQNVYSGEFKKISKKDLLQNCRTLYTHTHVNIYMYIYANVDMYAYTYFHMCVLLAFVCICAHCMIANRIWPQRQRLVVTGVLPLIKYLLAVYLIEI